MIKLGNINISDIKLGNTKINKVYLGSNLIYPLNILDSDVTNFIAANGVTDTTYINSLNTLVVYLKTNNIYNRIQAWWIFFGDASQSKFNFKNPIDSNGAFRLTFNGGGTINNDGFLCNGVNSFANTYFSPSLNQDLNNNGITLICGTNNPSASGDVIELGAYNTGSFLSTLVVKTDNGTLTRGSALNDVSLAARSTGIDEARGIFTGSKLVSNINKLYRNSTLIATGGGGGNLPTVSFYIGTMNFSNSPYGYSNQRLQQTIIHEGLNDDEISVLHYGLNIFEDSLGRKTW